MSSSTSARNESQNLQVTFLILYNGTYVVNPNPDPVLETAEIVLLGIVFLISLCGNTFLLVTIASSYTLRGDIFNILLANFSATFLIETVVNMSVALLYVAVDTWHLGNAGCAISSFTVQTVTIEITFGLCMMSVQSMILVKHPYEFQSFWTLKKQAVAIATFWAASILLCLPLLIQSIESRVFPPRYGCSFTGNNGFIYMLFVTIWCYGIMVVIGISCLINLGIYQYKEYKAQARKNGPNYSDAFIPGGLWTEWINVKLVTWLFLFYFLLEFPFIMMNQITGLKADSIESSTTPNSSHKYETVLTWFRYLYSCFYPCIVFKVRKDIRYKFRSLLHCCQPNVVRDHSAKPVIKQESKKKGNRKDSIPPISLNTPVLYISPEGLCLRQLAPPTKSFLNYTEIGKLNKAPNFISYLCDVECISISGDFSNHLDERSSSLSRRSSKESEISLSELGNSNSFKNESQDMPLKDLDLSISEPSPKPPDSPPRKKKVRFAETLTFYRAVTPKVETPTPDWVTSTPGVRQNAQTGIRSRHSKIPMRVHPVTSNPWKVEFNRNNNTRSTVFHRQTNQTERNFRISSNRKNTGTPIHWRFSE